MLTSLLFFTVFISVYVVTSVIPSDVYTRAKRLRVLLGSLVLIKGNVSTQSSS